MFPNLQPDPYPYTNLWNVPGNSYEAYKPPTSASCCYCCVHPFYLTRHFVTQLHALFGSPLLLSVLIIYGLQQGLGNAYLFQAISYYYKDILELSPSTAQLLTAVSLTPWACKPLYGLLSDAVPIFGYHRSSYIAIAGILGATVGALLLTIPLNPLRAVCLFFLINVSVASPDGRIASIASAVPSAATPLQSLCWGSLAFFAIIAFGTSGLVIDTHGPTSLFIVTPVVSALVLIIGVWNWIGEKPSEVEMDQSSRSNSSLVSKSSTTSVATTSTPRNLPTPLLFASFVIPFTALGLTASMLFLASATIRLPILVVVFLVLPIVYHCLLKATNLPVVANVGAFLFFTNAITPDIDLAMFYWLTSSDGLGLDAVMIGIISAVSFIAMFLGVTLFNAYFCYYSYRTLFSATLLFLSLLSLVDLVLVLRLNVKVGINDLFLIFGECALSPMMRRLFLLPIFVLVARVCPSGSEATVFSLLTALGNLGSSFSGYSGNVLLTFLHITSSDYDNLPIAIIVKSVSRLLPILLIPFLIPPGAPDERSHENNNNAPNNIPDDSVDESSNSTAVTALWRDVMPVGRKSKYVALV